MFLHPFRLCVSPRRTLQIGVFFLGCLSANLLALGVLVPELRQARSLQGLGRLSEDSETPHASAPAQAAQSAQRTLAVSLLSSSQAPTDSTGLSPPTRVRLSYLGFPHQLGTAATAASRHSRPAQAGLKGCLGQRCAGRRGRAARASQGRWGVAGYGRGRALASPR